MERQVKIKTPDGKTIYGLLRGTFRQPVIVFVHGLASFMNEHIYFNGVRYFERHGFSCFRFNLYDWQKGARKLHECTLQTHANDLDAVIKHLRKNGARKIFVVGHSYGGPTVLMSKQKQYDAVVLWDPTFWDPHIKQWLDFHRAKYFKPLRAYIDVWSCGVLIGQKMVHDARSMTAKKSEAQIATVHVPIKIIVAGKGILIHGGKRYFKAAHKPKAFAIIPDADHNFNFEGNEERLFRETLEWFKKWK